MRQEHGVGIAVPHLFGTDKHLFFAGVYVEEKLGSVHDFIDGVDRVFSAHKREKRYGIEHK